MISGDRRGMLEYWNADTFERPNRKTSKLVTFKHKGATDLYDMAKAKSAPQSICWSPDSKSFVVSASDDKYRVFDFGSGKLKRVYDESAEVVGCSYSPTVQEKPHTLHHHQQHTGTETSI